MVRLSVTLLDHQAGFHRCVDARNGTEMFRRLKSMLWGGRKRGYWPIGMNDSIRASTHGPACYEIGTGGPRGGNIEWHYVGETVNEKKRMSSYGRDGSHLSMEIRRHLRDGWHIYYHACACPSKEAAKQMQDNLLKKWKYDWNWIGNR